MHFEIVDTYFYNHSLAQTGLKQNKRTRNERNSKFEGAEKEKSDKTSAPRDSSQGPGAYT